MKEYIGMNFFDWCNLDPDDERKINYTIQYTLDGKNEEIHLTSEDSVNPFVFTRIQKSIIKNIELVDNEWFITLDY